MHMSVLVNWHSKFPTQICEAAQIFLFPVLCAAFTNFANIKTDTKGNVFWEAKFALFKPFLIC